MIDPPTTVHPLTEAARAITPDLLREVYLCPPTDGLDIAPHVGAEAFPWAESYAAAPRETAASVARALEDLVAAVPGMDPDLADPTGLEPDSRAARHLGALRDLWIAAGGAVPEHFAPLRHALRCRAEDALEPLPVIPMALTPWWTQADRDLMEMLRRHHGDVPAEIATRELARMPGREPAATGDLGRLQADLLGGIHAPDAPVRLLGLRDPWAELDQAAALAQRMLDDGTVDAANEIALLVPAKPAWLDRLAPAFERVGVPLSGLPGTPARDVGGEALRHLLACLRPGRAPSARASLFVSPAMSWDAATGAALARQALGQPAPSVELDAKGATLLAKLSAPVETEAALAERLGEIAGLVEAPLDALCRGLAAGLERGSDPPDWDRLFDGARPSPLKRPQPEPTVEGITVLLADRMPWRGARQLIALGLSGDRYPVAPAVNPLFLDSELDQIALACGIRMLRRADRLAERMELMRRQLAVAQEGITALISRRGLDGGAQPPAPLATLLARAIVAPASDPTQWDVPATPVPAAPRPAPVPADGRLALGRDLTALRRDEYGQPRPQSPSRLETLLVSPLAWLLDEMEARDLTWGAEEPTALSRGAVAHAVFERVFPAGASPDPARVVAAFEAALAEAVATEAPFYDRPDWSVDRDHLAAETHRAALAWADRLAGMGAEIVAAEDWLEGTAVGVPLAGKADAVLRLADGRGLVVDYKSGGSRRRRTRMEAGWDLQARLYLDLLGSMGRTADGIGYFGLGDLVLLTARPVPGAEAVGGDVSGAALAHIAARIDEIRGGIVALNTTGDARTLDKRGIGAWPLDASPLVAAHQVPEDTA